MNGPIQNRPVRDNVRSSMFPALVVVVYDLFCQFDEGCMSVLTIKVIREMHLPSLKLEHTDFHLKCSFHVRQSRLIFL